VIRIYRISLEVQTPAGRSVDPTADVVSNRVDSADRELAPGRIARKHDTASSTTDKFCNVWLSTLCCRKAFSGERSIPTSPQVTVVPFVSIRIVLLEYI
jgi:hypothetical protein